MTSQIILTGQVMKVNLSIYCSGIGVNTLSILFQCQVLLLRMSFCSCSTRAKQHLPQPFL